MLIANIDSTTEVRVYEIGGGYAKASVGNDTPIYCEIKHNEELGYYFNISLMSVLVDELVEQDTDLY